MTFLMNYFNWIGDLGKFIVAPAITYFVRASLFSLWAKIIPGREL